MVATGGKYDISLRGCKEDKVRLLDAGSSLLYPLEIRMDTAETEIERLKQGLRAHSHDKYKDSVMFDFSVL